MEPNKEIVNQFEEKVRKDLIEFLQRKDLIDKHVPDCPDVEAKWPEIIRAYIPDGTREFQQYPVVSLGWMMLIGMAIAYYWDTDWEKYAAQTDLYEQLRAIKGYDNLDDAVLVDIFGYRPETVEKVSDLAAECASRVYTMLTHSYIEPGTPEAFGCYVAALHQLYLAGMAMELNTLGYHMTPLNMN